MMNVIRFLFDFFFNRKLLFLLIGLIAFGALTIVLLDRVFMPSYTQYGHGVTVPDIIRLPVEDAIHALESRGLRYEVASERSNEAFPPDYVIEQNPDAGLIVKPNRKIYITVNVASAPTVSVPGIENLSLRNATIQLENAGLQVGNITYESSRFRNSVLRQSVPAGRRVDHHTAIDLIVGDGLGTAMVQIPDIQNMHLTEAQNVLLEAGLRVGSIRFEPTESVLPNTILAYDPEDSSVFEGTAIDLTVAANPSEEEEEEVGPLIIDESGLIEEDVEEEDEFDPDLPDFN
ncbi:PASTA domain-containing protein [Balneolaceae bacterium ANBcel3]|nr:PASTA domain-containing protein [Balneolaceae bacterium ANBcel3]